MKTLVQKVRAVERLFNQVDQELRTFQGLTSLHCLSGCGACCTHPEVEASVLEFLPFAYACYLEGKADEVLDQLRDNPSVSCHLYFSLSQEAKKGYCRDYAHRGLICRLFGFSVVSDKYGHPRLLTCRAIKSGQAEAVAAAHAALRENRIKAPTVRAYYQRLQHIDFRLAQSLFPINKALQMALQEVLAYYAYRPRRRAA